MWSAVEIEAELTASESEHQKTKQLFYILCAHSRSDDVHQDELQSSDEAQSQSL